MLKQLGAKAFHGVQRRVHRLVFDRGIDRSGIRTDGVIWQKDLALKGQNARHAVQYEPSPLWIFQRIMNGLEIDIKNYVFVDLGSGKGRTLLAAAERPFIRVDGVELSEALHQAAVENIAQPHARSKRRAPILPINDDATSYDFPTQPFILYMFNPFGKAVVEEIAARLDATLREQHRDVVIVYLNAKHRAVFDRNGDWVETPKSSLSKWIDRLISPWPIAVYRWNGTDRAGNPQA